MIELLTIDGNVGLTRTTWYGLARQTNRLNECVASSGDKQMKHFNHANSVFKVLDMFDIAVCHWETAISNMPILLLAILRRSTGGSQESGPIE